MDTTSDNNTLELEMKQTTSWAAATEMESEIKLADYGNSNATLQPRDNGFKASSPKRSQVPENVVITKKRGARNTSNGRQGSLIESDRKQRTTRFADQSK